MYIVLDGHMQTHRLFNNTTEWNLSKKIMITAYAFECLKITPKGITQPNV
jgi:hypothetical protein